MKYTVQKLASLSGVTVRTLHHYDQIGLLKPNTVGENGYRYYEDLEVNKLQTIMFYRELEFSLAEIKEILNSPHFNLKQALLDQKQLLSLKAKKIKKLMTNIDNTLKKGSISTGTDQFAAFSDYEMNQYKDEAKARWGNTDIYKESQKRTQNWTKEDYKKVGEANKKLNEELAGVMNLDVSNPKVQNLIDKHHQGIEIFYDCPKEMYRELGKMYVADPRFTTNYDKVRPGLAQFVCNAIQYYCDQK